MLKEILVVDSNLAVRKLMEFALTREGYEVAAFSDGISGLDAAFKTPPALFVVDNRMEGMNLIQFLEKVRQRENLRRIPVILLISAGDQYDEAKLRTLGMVDSIKKPLDPIEILEKVKTYSSADEADTVVTAMKSTPAPSSAEKAEPGDDMVRIEELLGWSSSAEESPFSEMGEVQEEDKKKESVEFELDLREKAPEGLKTAEPSLKLPEKEAESEEFILFDEELKATEAEQKESKLNQASFAAVSSASLPTEELPPLAPKTSTASPPVQGVSSAPSPSHVEEVTRQVAEEVVQKIAQDLLEKVIWEVVPPLAEITLKKEAGHFQIQPPPKTQAAPITPSALKTAPASLSQIEQLTRQVVEEMVRKMAQDVVEKVAWEVIPSLAEITLKKEINHLKGNA